MVYKFQNKALNNKVEILSNEVLIGSIQFNNWKSDVNAEINGKQYLIKKRSFWTRDFNFINVVNEEIIADISFETWSNKVHLNISSSDKYLFNRKGFWNRGWEIFGDNLQKIEFLTTKTFWDKSGEIFSNITNSKKSDLLITIGVFLIFYKMIEAAATSS
jgi:hypothetical protein